MKKKKTLLQYKLEDEWKERLKQSRKEFRKKRKEAYLSSSTLKQRKDFIELMRNGGISIEEASNRVGIDKRHAIDVYCNNFKKVFFYQLVPIEKVK